MPLKLVRVPHKNSDNWYLRGTIRRKRIFETTGTDDKEAAEIIRIKRESELLQRSIFGASATITFQEAAVSYLEHGGEAKYLGEEQPDGSWSLLIGHFWEKPLGMIGQDEADKAAAKLYPGTKAATRIRHCYGPLKAVLMHAAGRKWCGLPAFDCPEVDEVVTRFSSPERLEKLLPHCAPKLRRFVVMLAYTGGRLSEILSVDWDKDVFLARRTIMFWKTKTKQRPVHIPDPLLIELSVVPEAERHGPMFDWSDKCGPHKPLRTACKRAGVEYLPPHQQGRHTYATWMVDYAGLSLKELMEAGGWTSVQSVIRYLHTTPGKAAKQSEALPNVVKTGGKSVDGGDVTGS